MTDWFRVLRALAPHGRADIVAAVAARADADFRKYGITTALRQAHFLAHMSVESTGLTKLEENLSYSAARLCEVWERRFPTLASAEPYAHNPKKLAEKVYGGRMGNVAPGDAFTFRGHGLLQETGRENATELAHHLGIPIDRVLEWLVDPAHMLECACARFVLNGCLRYADRDEIEGSTRAINGGLTGLKDRRRALLVARKVLSVATPNPFGGLARVGFASTDEGGVTILDDDVRQAQRRLKELGFFPGAIDGDLGDATRVSIDAFQRRNDLPVSGELDDATRAALGSRMARARAVSPKRTDATVEDLREQGSETIAAADDASAGVSATKVALGGAGGLAALGSVSDGINATKSAQDSADILPRLWHWTLLNWPLALIVALAAFVWWKHRDIERALHRVRTRRLHDHKTFRHAGR